MLNYSTLNKQLDSMLTGRKASGNDLPPIDSISSIIPHTIESLSMEDNGPEAISWLKFNECFGKFRPREFTVLCGTTGAGKTAFLANLSVQLMAGITPHFVASVETGAVDYMRRILSILEGKDLNRGDAVPLGEVQSIFKKWDPFFKRNTLFFSPYQNKTSHKRLMCDLLYAKEKHGCKVAFIDNLNFLMPIVNQNEALTSMDRIVHDFIIFCKNIDMHIVMVMHPRKKEDTDGFVRVENEYDIKGSSTVVQEAHNVILLNRPTKSQEDDGYSRQTCREIKFSKLRRRGNYTGTKIMFECVDSKYVEKL